LPRIFRGAASVHSKQTYGKRRCHAGICALTLYYNTCRWRFLLISSYRRLHPAQRKCWKEDNDGPVYMGKRRKLSTKNGGKNNENLKNMEREMRKRREQERLHNQYVEAMMYKQLNPTARESRDDLTNFFELLLPYKFVRYMYNKGVFCYQSFLHLCKNLASKLPCWQRFVRIGLNIIVSGFPCRLADHRHSGVLENEVFSEYDVRFCLRLAKNSLPLCAASYWLEILSLI